MKKYLLYIFILLIISSCEKNSTTNNESKDNLTKLNKYALNLTKDVRWNNTGLSQVVDEGRLTINSLIQYYTKGDTMINNRGYAKLWSVVEEQIIDNHAHDTSYHYEKTFKACVRQDPNTFKVYINISGYDELLYDFRLQLNDTVNTWLTRFAEISVVTNVDSIIVDNEYRKIYTISSNGILNAAEIIEGIGSNKGLINNITFGLSYIYLKCYKVNGEILYESFPNHDYCKDIIELANN